MSAPGQQQPSAISSYTWKCPDFSSQQRLRMFNSFTNNKVIDIETLSINLFNSLGKFYTYER
jgi:hypothetical protein